jgi:hypothetical protein
MAVKKMHQGTGEKKSVGDEAERVSPMLAEHIEDGHYEQRHGSKYKRSAKCVVGHSLNLLDQTASPPKAADIVEYATIR